MVLIILRLNAIENIVTSVYKALVTSVRRALVTSVRKALVTSVRKVLRTLAFYEHISDINNEMTFSTVSGFTDYTRIFLGINDEDYTQMLQNNT